MSSMAVDPDPQSISLLNPDQHLAQLRSQFRLLMYRPRCHTVLGRVPVATTLQSIETHPFDWGSRSDKLKRKLRKNAWKLLIIVIFKNKLN